MLLRQGAFERFRINERLDRVDICEISTWRFDDLFAFSGRNRRVQVVQGRLRLGLQKLQLQRQSRVLVAARRRVLAERRTGVAGRTHWSAAVGHSSLIVVISILGLSTYDTATMSSKNFHKKKSVSKNHYI